MTLAPHVTPGKLVLYATGKGLNASESTRDLRVRFNRSPLWAGMALGSIMLLALTSAHATQVGLPLRISHPILDEALKERLFTVSDGRALLWSGADPCQHLYAEDPRFGPGAPAVKLETVGSLTVRISSPFVVLRRSLLLSSCVLRMALLSKARLATGNPSMPRPRSVPDHDARENPGICLCASETCHAKSGSLVKTTD